jgi:flagellar biosynthesis protein FliQ
MTIAAANELAINALIATGKLAGPMLLVALIVGVVVGVLQAATQINEASISFVLKLLAVGTTLMVLGSWTLGQLVDYTQKTIESTSQVVR